MQIITYSPHNKASLAREILRVIDPKIDFVGVNTLKRLNRINTFDGLLLLGGRDIEPVLYGEENRHAQRPDQHRDMIEWAMVRRALTENVPIFGICRGMQMLTVACGGSLYQDLKVARVSSFNHASGYHWLKEVKRPLRDLMPSLKVNSRHHQSVRTVPYGMKVLARSSDGVIESVWRPGVLGVQWHPEMMFREEYHWYRLFEWFLRGLQ